MFRYLTPVLAAVTGIVYAGLGPFPVTGLTPNLLVAGTTVVVVAGGLSAATIWSLVAGFSANLLLDAPMGSIPLVLLAVAGVIDIGRRALPAPALAWIAMGSAGGALLSGIVAAAIVSGTPTALTGLWDELGLVAIETALVAVVAGVAVRRFGRLDEADGHG